MTVRDPNTPADQPAMLQPSPFWGDEVDLDSQNNVHNPMFDENGPRVVHLAPCAPPDNPAFCKAGIQPSVGEARSRRTLRPPARGLRSEDQAALAHETRASARTTCCSPKTRTTRCGPAAAAAAVVGWLNTKMWDQTARRGRIAGLDRAGARHQRQRQARRLRRGRISRSIRRRTRASTAAFYGVAPRAGRIDLGHRCWDSRAGSCGWIRARIRRRRRWRSTTKCRGTIRRRRSQGFSPRGMDVDRNGVVWVALGSGHLASFDRRKCKGPLNGPKATGQHCPEGWTLYPEPVPQFKKRDRFGQRRFALLRLGGSQLKFHAQARGTHPPQPRTRTRNDQFASTCSAG